MDSGLYSAVSAMRTSLTSLDVMAHNLSNLGTHGFKRSTAAAKEFVVYTDHGPARALTVNGAVDHGQGGLDRTGDQFHLALTGDGFFAAETPDGERYTRVGRLAFDEIGTLVTAEGYPLAWEQKDADLDPSLETPVIDADGTVHQGLIVVGRLKVTSFEDNSKLVADAAGYWEAPAQLLQVPSEAVVKQGFLERSNAEGVVELINLVENQRAYEIASKAVTQIDQSYRRLNQGRS